MIQRAPTWTWITLTAIVVTLTLFGIVTLIPDGDKDAKAALVNKGTRVTVVLRGWSTCSDEVDLNAGPRGNNNFYPGLGAEKALVRLPDGSTRQITSWGPIGGKVCFYGPPDTTVTVEQTPF